MSIVACRLCALFAEHEEPGVAMAALISSVEPSDSIPLCNGHWNRWLAVFLPLHAHERADRLAAVPSATRDEVARAVRSVTDHWDEPLDEVHDVPPIADTLLARFTITPKADR